MSRDSGARRRWWRQLEPGFLLIVAACSQLPPTSSVAIPRIPAGEARLWFYRDGGPYEIQASPYLRLNGRVAGISEPDGTFYRDVTPRHYVVTVDSYLDSYVDQFASIDLAAGQEAMSKSCPCGGTSRVAKPDSRRHFFHTHYPRRHRPGGGCPPPLLRSTNCGDRLTTLVGNAAVR